MKYYLFLCSFFLLSPGYASDSKYQLGQGIQVGDLPLYIGGYSSLEYNNIFGKEQSLKLDELALMLYGEHNNLSYMFEMETEDVFTKDFGDKTSETQEDHFRIERLYFNYDFNENHALKIGKYSSSVGFWNITPINVLRATTSDPLIATKLFPIFTSGLEFQYQTLNTESFTFTAFLQHNKDLDKIWHENPYNNFDIDRHYGLGISFQDEQTTYQFNAGYFHLLSNQSYSYLAGSFQTEFPDDILQGEIGTQFIEGQQSLSYIGYLQWVHTLKAYHESILRVESYNDQILKTNDTFLVIGYTYRPYYPVALKAEYQWHSNNEENQILLSLSVLF